MSNQINLTVSLKEEDRARIDALTAALQNLSAPKIAPQPQEVEPVKEMAQEPENVQENASQPAAEPAPTPLPDIGDGSEVPAPQLEAAAAVPDTLAAPTCSREDVQRKVVELAAAGKKVEVRDIVNAYAPRVSAIPEADLDECMAKLCALEG